MSKANSEIAELKAKLASMQAKKDKMLESNAELRGTVRSLQSKVEKVSTELAEISGECQNDHEQYYHNQSTQSDTVLYGHLRPENRLELPNSTTLDGGHQVII